jgi:hypothetical protein
VSVIVTSNSPSASKSWIALPTSPAVKPPTERVIVSVSV